VAHKNVGIQKKHRKRGLIKGIVSKKNKYLYRIKFAGIKGIWLETVSHIRLSKLNKKKYSKERKKFLMKMNKAKGSY
jgi:hypothetical protein